MIQGTNYSERFTNKSRLNLRTLVLSTLTIEVFATASASRAASLDDFKATTLRLQEQQQKLDAALRKHGVSPLSPTPSAASSEDPEKSHPILVIHTSLSRTQVPQGRLHFGRTLQRLIVGAEGSPILIELDPSQGAVSELRLMGTARQSATPGRLQIDFQKLLLHSGKSLSIQATALDESGAYGLAAQVFSQKSLAILGAMASSFVSGLAASQQSQTVNAFGFQQTQATGRNAILQGVAQSAADQSKRLIDESTAEKPVLMVEPNTPVTVFFQEEVRF